MRSLFCFTLLLAAGAAAQTPSPLAGVADDFQKRLDSATHQLAETRAGIEKEKVPLTRRLNELDDQVIEARKEYDRVLRLADARQLDLTNLRAQIKSREDQSNYVANAVDEFIRNFEARLHIAEVQRHGDVITAKKNAANNANLDAVARLESRLDLLDLALDRMEEALGGAVFAGSAVEARSGVVSEGKFLIFGPLGFFAGTDGKQMGLADLRLGSNEPAVLTLPAEAKPEEIATTVAEGKGRVPVDVTRGSAFKVEETKMTIWQEFLKGGPVMWPIGGLGAVAVLVGLVKWLQLALVRRPNHAQVGQFLTHLDAGRFQDAGAIARRTGGPIGRMLGAVLQHYRDPASMLEEAMFERVLDAKTRLNAYIPFIKIAAAVEPLLGLLGTVTGMINTFKLITVFGTQDASTFSSGISEALITTEWGLITAIPCLLMAAFLARLSRAALDDMEKLAVRIMNHRNARELTGSAPPASSASDEPEAPGALPVPAV